LQQLPKLSTDSIEKLKNSQNLLAYSAGSDSNALFYILQAHNIEFDIALVNYKTREQSDAEESYAKELARKCNKKCFSFTCKLETNNFEHNARVKRYEFFEQIISHNNYKNLITAHHLNDKLEWFFMQLSRGAGLVEMLGFEEIQEQSNYNIIRPLITTSKTEIENFLHVNGIKHFIDASNTDTKYKRNTIRETYTNAFAKEYKEGIIKSFTYLQEDAKRLVIDDIKAIKDLFILDCHSDDLLNIRAIDKIVKKLGYLLSHEQREEILKTRDCVLGDKIVVTFSHEKIYISPYVHITMEKKFKELCRVAKIPKKIRPYMYKENILPNELCLAQKP
jgi:tRNA(Ile)-lysidine synthase